MKIFPVRDQVVVTKDAEKEQVSLAGIISVSLSPDRNVPGTVQSVGTGRVTMSGMIVPLEVQAGDKVLFNPGQANEVKVDGSTVFLCREDNLVVLR